MTRGEHAITVWPTCLGAGNFSALYASPLVLHWLLARMNEQLQQIVTILSACQMSIQNTWSSGPRAVIGHSRIERCDQASHRTDGSPGIHKSFPGVEKGGVGTRDSTSGGNAREVANA